MSKKRRIVKWTLGILLLAVLVTAGWLYVKASQVPTDYTPIQLTASQKIDAKRSLDVRLQEFARLAGEISSIPPGASDVGVADAGDAGTGAQKREFMMAVSQDEMNEWAATVSEKLENTLTELGMSQPAIAFGKDRLTFYSRWDQYNKVVGMDMSLRFDNSGLMTVQIQQARIGNLPMPEKTLQQHKAQIVSRLQSHVRTIGTGGGQFAGQPTSLFNQAAAQAADALSGRPVQLDIREGFGNVRIRGIKMEQGKATLDVVSLAPQNQDPSLLKTASYRE